MKPKITAERVSNQDVSDNYVYQRSLLAYIKTAGMISGNVLELGTGNGYAVDILSLQADKLVTLDKFKNKKIDSLEYKLGNVNFIKMKFPPLNGIPDNFFDFVISFQVIEHIKDDNMFLKEVNRVLKPEGQLIITTPNKAMSITRNPWHVREYTHQEFSSLLNTHFAKTDAYGVFGNEKIEAYYQKNKAAVAKISKYDIFDFQHKLPRWALQFPYDILNRLNRKRILKENQKMVTKIKLTDYYFDKVNTNCYDLFYVAYKKNNTL